MKKRNKLFYIRNFYYSLNPKKLSARILLKLAGLENENIIPGPYLLGSTLFREYMEIEMILNIKEFYWAPQLFYAQMQDIAGILMAEGL